MSDGFSERIHRGSLGFPSGASVSREPVLLEALAQ
jgi:hypothetical protein